MEGVADDDVRLCQALRYLGRYAPSGGAGGLAAPAARNYLFLRRDARVCAITRASKFALCVRLRRASAAAGRALAQPSRWRNFAERGSGRWWISLGAVDRCGRDRFG